MIPRDSRCSSTWLSHQEQCPIYKNCAIDAYERAGTNSLLRARLETAASGTPFYAELKRISFKYESLALFGEDSYAGRPIVNIKGKNVSVGVVAGGNVSVSGDVNVSQKVDSVKDVLSELSTLLETATEHVVGGRTLPRQGG